MVGEEDLTYEDNLVAAARLASLGFTWREIVAVIPKAADLSRTAVERYHIEQDLVPVNDPSPPEEYDGTSDV